MEGNGICKPLNVRIQPLQLFEGSSSIWNLFHKPARIGFVTIFPHIQYW